jgi:hypothetical protein
MVIAIWMNMFQLFCLHVGSQRKSASDFHRLHPIYLHFTKSCIKFKQRDSIADIMQWASKLLHPQKTQASVVAHCAVSLWQSLHWLCYETVVSKKQHPLHSEQSKVAPLQAAVAIKTYQRLSWLMTAFCEWAAMSVTFCSCIDHSFQWIMQIFMSGLVN